MARVPSAPNFCGYPVEKAAARSAVKVTPHVLHSAQSPLETQAADTARHHFDEKGSGKIDEHGKEGFQFEHASMVALISRLVKAGNLGSIAAVGTGAKFSRLFKWRVVG